MVIDAWQMPEPHGRPGLQPRGLVFDLHGCSILEATLEEIRGVMPAERVLVVTALGTPTPEDVRQMGFTSQLTVGTADSDLQCLAVRRLSLRFVPAT